jgi:hypothetical protein
LRRASVLLKFSIFSLSTLHSVIERLSSCGDQEQGGGRRKNQSEHRALRAREVERGKRGEGGGAGSMRVAQGRIH